MVDAPPTWRIINLAVLARPEPAQLWDTAYVVDETRPAFSNSSLSIAKMPYEQWNGSTATLAILHQMLWQTC